MPRPRLAIIATHPIQYYAPVFKLLTGRAHLDCHVFYGWAGGALGAVRDPGFGRMIAWDVPLLEGYEHTFVPNQSTDPGTHHWNGIRSTALLPLLRAWDPNAVLVYGWNYRSHLSAMRALHGRTPILLRGDSTVLDERHGPRVLVRRAVLRYVYRYVDMGVYVGVHNREYFRRHGLKERQLRWAPHSVDNARFADSSGRAEAEARSWRRKLGIPDDHATILFAGKLEAKKAPDFLLRVFLRRAAAKEHLLIVGTGALEMQLRETAAGHPHVHFLGFQNQSMMPVVYRLGDVFVLPSRGPGETWGLAVNEAMASARPVIVSDRVGCAPDLVNGGDTGIVFESENEEALHDGLVRVIDDLPLRRSMGECARRRIAEWSFEAQVTAIENAVSDAITSPC